MNLVTDKQLFGFYGSFKDRPKTIYHAIAIGRILFHRGHPLPSRFDELLSRVRDWTDEGYSRRRKLLTYFGIGSYQQYLDSELWAAVRAVALKLHNGNCRFCGERANQVHHRSYDIGTLSGATPDRLYPSCRECHRKVEFDEHDRKRTFDAVVAATLAASR